MLWLCCVGPCGGAGVGVGFVPTECFISYAFLPMLLHAHPCRPMSDWVKVEILCWQNVCFVKRIKNRNRIVSYRIGSFGRTRRAGKKEFSFCRLPWILQFYPQWQSKNIPRFPLPNKIWKKAGVSCAFQYYSKAFETVKINNPKNIFPFDVRQTTFPKLWAVPCPNQIWKKGQRFLCFSILFESIWNCKN